MPSTDELQFEMQRRVILFNSGTTMPDNINVLGYEGNPNLANTSTSGQTLLYNSPRGTHYIELVNGNLWYKQQIPNTWINLTSGTQSGITGLDLNSYATTINLFNTGSILDNKINSLSGSLLNLNSNPSGFITGVDLSSYLTSSTASSTYATITNLNSTGNTLNSSITSLSGLFTGYTGYFESENTIGYSYVIPVGNDNYFVTYPSVLNSDPRSINCIFQNNVDNVIYYYSIGNITKSGFFINFSDQINNTGYSLNINIKK